MKNRQHTPLSQHRILAAALHLIDTQGLRRLTMRRLGDALDVEAMAIYHHFPRGKEALLDALVEHISAVPADAPRDADWRAPLRAWAHSMRGRAGAHPELLPLLITRPAHSPAALATLEAQYAAFHDAGLRGPAIIHAAHALACYVIGSVALEAREGNGSPPPADGRHPHVAALAGHHESAPRRFEAGLDTVFAGISAQLGARRA